MDGHRRLRDLGARIQYADHHVGVGRVAIGHERAGIDTAGSADQELGAVQPERVTVERIRAGGRENDAARRVRDRCGRMPAAEGALACARFHPGGVEPRFECHGDIATVAASGEGAHGIAPLVRGETACNSGIVQCAASASEAARPKLIKK